MTFIFLTWHTDHCIDLFHISFLKTTVNIVRTHAIMGLEIITYVYVYIKKEHITGKILSRYSRFMILSPVKTVGLYIALSHGRGVGVVFWLLYMQLT